MEHFFLNQSLNYVSGMFRDLFNSRQNILCIVF